MVDPKNIAFLERYGVLTETETRARYVAQAEQYAKLINIEANTMVYMVRHMYLPALFDYSGDIATSVATKAEIGIESRAERRSSPRSRAASTRSTPPWPPSTRTTGMRSPSRTVASRTTTIATASSPRW